MARTKPHRRSTYISIPNGIEIQRSPVTIVGCDGDGNFVCRLYITNAGIEVYAAANGKEQLINKEWEGFVRLLRKVRDK